MAPRVRLILLMTGLTLACLLLWQRQAGSLLPNVYYPATCNRDAPDWLPVLKSLAQELDYPGFQIAHHTVGGEPTLCAAGWAKTSGFPQPMRNEHQLRYASLSKIMTALAAAELIAEGRMQLDNTLPLLLGLPGEPEHYADPYVATVTLHQLLSHTAGFDRSITPDPMITPTPWCPNNLSTLMSVRLDHPPGAKYTYANIGYCLVGAAISHAHQLALPLVFERRFIKPLGLESTRLAPNGHLLPDEAQPHFAPEESISDLLRIDYSSAAATGAWTGTARDLVALLAAYFGQPHPLLPPHTQGLLATDSNCDRSIWRNCHGLAFYQHSAESKVAYWRDGSLPGITAIAMLFPNGSNVVFLANSRPYEWIKHNDRLGQALLQLIHP